MARKKKLLTKKEQKAINGCIGSIFQLIFLPITILIDTLRGSSNTKSKRRR